MKIKSVFIVIAVAAITACSEIKLNQNEGPVEFSPISLTKAQQECVQASNLFGHDFMRMTLDVEGVKDANWAFSPLGMYTALSMLENGAEGETLAEISHVLHHDGIEIHDNNVLIKYLYKKLLSADNKVQFMAANLAWSKSDKFYIDRYQKILTDKFSSEFMTFNQSSEKSVQEINKWVKDNTGGMIDDFVTVDHIGKAEMMLVNTNYFDGKWTVPFNKEKTTKDIFHNADGSTSKVYFMNEEIYECTEVAEDYYCIRLKYGNGAFVMGIILPKEGGNIDDIIAKHDLSTIQFKSTERKTTLLSLPKFTLANSWDNIPAILKEMGMKAAFTADCQFGNMTTSKIVIGDVLQSVKIDVSEEGTKAASASGITDDPISPDPSMLLTLKVNRPFAFFISESSTKTVLFSGIVRNL